MISKMSRNAEKNSLERKPITKRRSPLTSKPEPKLESPGRKKRKNGLRLNSPNTRPLKRNGWYASTL
jgi:hypothetical protein